MSEAFGREENDTAVSATGPQSQLSMEALRHIHEAQQRRQHPTTVSVDTPLYATPVGRANKPIRWEGDHQDGDGEMEMTSLSPTDIVMSAPVPHPGTFGPTTLAPSVMLATRVSGRVPETGTSVVGGGTSANYVVPPELEDRWRRALDEERQLNLLTAEIERKEAAAKLTLQRLTPNFPPAFLCIQPLVHHNIPADIPIKRQRTVKIAFGNWIATSVLLFLNFIICLSVSFVTNKDGLADTEKLSAKTTSQHVGLSVAYLTGIVFSFLLWYWQFYKSIAFGRSTTYLITFVGLLIGAAFSAFAAIGITGLGGCGAVFASDIARVKGTAASVPVGILCAFWAVQVLVFLFLMFRLRKYYKEDGASTEEAKRQIMQGATRTAIQHAI